jgi:hypothetical protein
MKIYLDEPITLYGIRVGHTYEGLKYLIDHYEHMLSIARPNQMDDKARAHCQWLIENLKQHLQLYERHQTDTAGTEPSNK